MSGITSTMQTESVSALFRACSFAADALEMAAGYFPVGSVGRLDMESTAEVCRAAMDKANSEFSAGVQP